MLMKMGDYLAEVHGDADAREEHYVSSICLYHRHIAEIPYSKQAST